MRCLISMLMCQSLCRDEDPTKAIPTSPPVATTVTPDEEQLAEHPISEAKNTAVDETTVTMAEEKG